MRVRKMTAAAVAVSVATLAAAPVLARAAAAAEEGGLPQLRQTDTFASQVFWLAVFFAVLYVLLNRLFLPRLHNAISEREARIQGDLTRAEDLRRESGEMRETLEAELTRTRQEAASRVREMREAALARSAEEQARLTEKLDAELRAGEARLLEERRASEARLLDDAAPWVSAIAERLGGRAVSVDEARRLLEGEDER
ncbi:MAG: hypothetical protein MPJ79_06785 [Alphaproteobacteria bacterium]|nr:hypothetical protein [Alphaproteobacteria bacterium]MDA7983806.1 hypothetical protein [Alphaproteobacteria bacterium]MDA7985130.1 hypothetical protein [Alphaproteobacteria bacterium]MDA7988021.1 hypothetical protein [Alphaproteobacteria bacterium]MDA7989443.1 hypothetical protein [Alphaproteobacteria bacterium]